jgi:peptidyl-prolyl cis-trans isomerase A (cyclophilin A)
MRRGGALVALWIGCTPRAPDPVAPEAHVIENASATATAAIADEPPIEAPPRVAPDDPRLLTPNRANERAPQRFRVRFHTTKGDVVIEAHRDWSPKGVDRFYNLVRLGFFRDIALYRVIPGFVVQFGIHGRPEVAAAWKDANIDDEPVKQGNTRGRVVFAKAGPNTRTTQLFINTIDNSRLDGMGFGAIGEVTSGMDVVDSFHSGYGGNPSNRQTEIAQRGNAWLRQEYPLLDYIEQTELSR